MFVTWPQGARFRSWLTSSGVASHQTAPSCEEPDRSTRMATRRITVLSVCPAWPESQNRPMFRGPSWDDPYRVPLCSPRSTRNRGNRVARQEDISSGASYRLAPYPLPKEPQHCLPAEIGPLVTCRTRLPSLALGEAGTAVPITQ